MKTKSLLLSIGALFIYITALSQVNTPAGATWPFGSRIAQFPTNPYDYGIIPGNLPAGAYNPASNQYGKSQDAYDAYVEWKNCYAVNCGTGTPNQWRIRFDDAGQTVSEGIAYGMLLAVYAADKTLFDGLWAYYRAHSNGRGLMHWKWGNPGDNANGCSGTRTGTDAAADAELDAAMALIIAECQWPTVTSPYNYAAEAEYLISRIRQHEIPTSCAAGNMQISNGDGWIVGCPANNDCRNPSYQAPAYTRHFQAYDPGAPGGFWNTVTNNAYTLLNANRNATTGFVSNWSSPAGAANTCAAPAFTDHGYDAIRNPWRMAKDYLWFGTTQARDNFNQPMSNYFRTQSGTYTNPANLRGPVTLAGAHIGGRTTASPDATFTSMWATAAMGVNSTANNHATLDFMYTRARNVKDALNCTAGSNSGYFGNTLRVVSLFMLTGNFWKPCPPRCQAPVFAQDSISTCGPSSVVLNSGLPTATGRTFQWFKNNVSLGAATSGATTLTVNATSPAPNGPGWFKVKVDTTGGCSLSDSIYVKSTAVTPKLGPNLNICSPSSLTLNANILGTGYSYVWEHSSDGVYANLGVIPDESAGTLQSVRRPGLYKVTAIKAGCANLWDTLTVTSTLASPQDACNENASASVTLSVVGPNLGPASNYDWYSVPTGGSVLSGGNDTYTYTTPVLSSAGSPYTYYIKDNSKQYGSVGKSSPTSPPATCGALSMNADGITAGWGTDNNNVYSQTWVVNRTIDIDSVTVWFCLYNSSMPTINFRLLNSNGSSTLQTTAARPGVRIVNPTAVYGPPYDGRIQGVRYYVGINGVTAGTYRLTASTVTYTPPQAFANMLLEQHPTNIAYTYKDNMDGNTATILNSFGYSTSFSNRYAHFYDWTISAPNNCDRIPVYAYIGFCPDALPVTLLSFTADVADGKVKTSWGTSSEKDASHFVVQRSSNGEHFQDLTHVSARGNSDVVNWYFFQDIQPLYGVSYYRLAMYDLDGTVSYSKVVVVDLRAVSGVDVFPNPASDEVTITVKENKGTISSVSVFDIVGKEKYSVAGEFTTRTINLKDLPDGTYILKIQYEEQFESVRFVKQSK